MAERWPRAVVFDLDGTLIDSAGDIADALNSALARSALAPFSEAEVRLMVGGGTRVLVERALAARDAGTDSALAQRLHADFIAAYHAVSVARTAVYDHGRELLAELTGQGLRLAICTNKPQAITDEILVKLGLRGSFQSVIGGNEALPKKPHPAMLAAALEALGVRPDDCVMVGDSSADVGAARAAKMPVIAVSFGYSRTPARELGADLIIDSLADIPAALERLKILRSKQLPSF